MKSYAIAIVALLALLEASDTLYTVVDCPSQSAPVVATYDSSSSRIYCTMRLVCTSPYHDFDHSMCTRNHLYDDSTDYECVPTEDEDSCVIKFEIAAVDDFDVGHRPEVNPCSASSDDEGSALLPHPDNCNWFYKCDWGAAVLFECPAELHFNAELRVCDWPWRAKCDDSSWLGCPRPRPHCPARHPHPLYLPHPHLCDRFYQCSWGTAHLQTCPTGLHFNPRLNICDWPHNSKCRVC